MFPFFCRFVIQRLSAWLKKCGLLSRDRKNWLSPDYWKRVSHTGEDLPEAAEYAAQQIPTWEADVAADPLTWPAVTPSGTQGALATRAVTLPAELTIARPPICSKWGSVSAVVPRAI